MGKKDRAKTMAELAELANSTDPEKFPGVYETAKSLYSALAEITAREYIASQFPGRAREFDHYILASRDMAGADWLVDIFGTDESGQIVGISLEKLSEDFALALDELRAVLEVFSK